MILDRLACLLFGCKYQTYEFRPYVRLVRCTCCDRRYAMNDREMAFLRYDNDPVFRAGLLEIYPELDGIDI